MQTSKYVNQKNVIYATITVLIETEASNRQIRHILKNIYNIDIPRSEIQKLINEVKKSLL